MGILINLTFLFISFVLSLSQSRDILKAIENLDASTKKTILNLHGQGVKKEDIASRISYVVKDKSKAHQIIDGVTADAKKNDPKRKRDEALAAKRKLQQRQNLIKKQERDDKLKSRRKRTDL